MKSKCVIRATASIMAALMIFTSQAQEKIPSVIGMQDTTVYIDDDSVPNEYFGPVFVGDRKEVMSVLYDTMSDWTVLSDDYEVQSSKTSNAWLYEDDGSPIINDMPLGSMVFSGPMYNETMCLIKHEDGETRLCIEKYPFISARASEGFYSYEGVLGLSHGEMNFMKFMKEENQLMNNVVSFDYDTHNNVDSSVRFGVFDTKKAKDGKLYKLPSVGHSKWVLKLDSVEFNDVQMSKSGDDHIAGNVAFIDSGNTTIQFPMNVYQQVYHEIKKLQDGDIRFRESYDFPAGRSIKIIKVNTQCDDIVDDLPTLRINFEGGVTIEIEPRGYVYKPAPGDYYCKIGLSGVEGSKQYRLGTQFLKNFYTVLDYDNKQVMIGSKGSHSTIRGDESLLWQPPKPDPLPEPQPSKPDEDDHTSDSHSTPDQEEHKDDKQDTQTPDDDNKEPIEQPDVQPKEDDKPKDDDKPEPSHDDQQPTDEHDQNPDQKDKEDEPQDTPKDDDNQPPVDDNKDKEEPKKEEDKKPAEEEHKIPDVKPSPPPPPPAPKPKPPKKVVPAKPKGFVDTYILDPIDKLLLEPIYGFVNWIQTSVDVFVHLILAPIDLMKKLI